MINIKLLSGATDSEWSDWRWQLANSVRTMDGLCSLVGRGVLDGTCVKVANRFPLQTTPFYLSLADSTALDDPVLMQCVPQDGELADCAGSTDPFHEQDASPVPRLVHRYRDRALFMACGCCAVHCRHCMRKRVWDEIMPAPTDEELAACAAYLESHPEVREVLISGGDPLTLEDDDIERIIAAFAAVKSIEMLRIGSRTLVALPQRYTESLCDILGNAGKAVWIAAHFNHPQELSPEAGKAVLRLMAHGVPVVNQTVLLKGINDDADTLAALFTGLLRLRIKPYYLFHGDPVSGTTCFRTGIAKGVELMAELRGRISGMALPAFAIDLPEGGGKVRLEPDSYVGESQNGKPVYRKHDGSPIEYI